MIITTEATTDVVGGFDTHRDTHQAAIIGRVLGSQELPANEAGYVEMLDWMQSLGHVDLTGGEGTGMHALV